MEKLKNMRVFAKAFRWNPIRHLCFENLLKLNNSEREKKMYAQEWSRDELRLYRWIHTGARIQAIFDDIIHVGVELHLSVQVLHENVQIVDTHRVQKPFCLDDEH